MSIILPSPYRKSSTFFSFFFFFVKGGRGGGGEVKLIIASVKKQVQDLKKVSDLDYTTLKKEKRGGEDDMSV